MGKKLFDTGLFFVLSAGLIFSVPYAAVVGAVLMLIGVILEWLDK